MSPAVRQLALVNTVIFAVGVLAGYIIRDIYTRLKQRRGTVNKNSLADQPHRAQKHRDKRTANSRTRTEHQREGGEEGEEEEVEVADGSAAAAAASAAVRSAIPKCQSSEDIFFDAPCDSDDNNFPAMGDVAGSSNAPLSSTTTTITTIADRQLLYAQVDQLLELLENGGSSIGSSSSPAELVQTALETLKQHQATVKCLIDRSINLSDDANYWWRRSRAIYLLSKADGHYLENKKTTTNKNALMNEAVEHAQRALELDQLNGDANKWRTGRRRTRPFSTCAAASTWSFWGETAWSRWSPDGPSPTFPEGVSLEHALEDFLTAHRLRSAWKENILHLSKALLKLGRHAEAATFISQGLELPLTAAAISTSEESLAHSKLNELLGKCKTKKK
ncbi:Regulator of Microtubule Dynamics [Tyrophagus putrescentiae]|nr:Regulator of Microtubule Dynamics [Tyrophagus putrescentiae]